MYLLTKLSSSSLAIDLSSLKIVLHVPYGLFAALNEGNEDFKEAAHGMA